MKKKTFKAVAIVMAIISVLGLAACKKTEPVSNEIPEEPGEEITGDFSDDNMVEYYGCPNSKRVKKLNLLKK